MLLNIIAFSLRNFNMFLVVDGCSLFFLFLTQAPAMALALVVVPPNVRTMAMAMCTVAVHVLGDGPSPFLVGIMQDEIKNWRVTLKLLDLVLVPGIIALAIGIFISKAKRWDGKEESANETTPLLNTSK